MKDKLKIEVKTVIKETEQGISPKTVVELTTENGKVIIPCVDSQANAITQDLLRFVQKYLDATEMELTVDGCVSSQVGYAC